MIFPRRKTLGMSGLKSSPRLGGENKVRLPPPIPVMELKVIGVALCLGQHSYDLDQLRAAAQLLSSPRVNATRLCRLAIQERCEPVLLHIAHLAGRFAPELEPWVYLRRHLPPRPVPRTDALPQWSRLVSRNYSDG